MLWKELTIILLCLWIDLVCSLEPKYHSNSELEEYLKNFTENQNNGLTTRLYSIGKSKKGQNLWVLEMTAAQQDRIGVPNIKFIGTIHGNEPVGREVLLYFMEHLRDNYKTNSTIQWLLENTRIHFLPNLNPDGFNKSRRTCHGEEGRNNGDSFDLNRNFPGCFHKNRMWKQPETAAVEKWMSNTPFILSAALHGGALVANYPYDSVKERTSLPKEPPSLTADDDVFKHLATVYAKNHATMHKGIPCLEDFEGFDGGITNGAAWYSFTGGMQDYNYCSHGCMELTLEISCCKFPPAQDLPNFWEENKEAMLAYSLEAHKGVTGQILDSVTLQPVVNARLQISGRDVTFYSKHRGEFWRLLLPGNYKLEISADGYYNQTEFFVVKNDNTSSGLTFLKVYLINSTLSTTMRLKTTKTTVLQTTTTEYMNTTPDVTSSIPSATAGEFLIVIAERFKNNGPNCSVHSKLHCCLLIFLSIIYCIL